MNGIWFPCAEIGASLQAKQESWEKIREMFTKKENNMERNLKMTVKQAQKLYKEQPEMRELLLTTFTKEELECVVLKGWYELGDYINEGWFIDEISSIHQKNVLRANFTKRYFATEKQAKSALAMAQLSQLMKDLGDECNVDWSDYNKQTKYTIIRHNIFLTYPTATVNGFSFLAFKTAGVCCEFAVKHDRLIRDYFMLD